jgi:transposase
MTACALSRTPPRRRRSQWSHAEGVGRPVVERAFAWISKHRRTVRDYERLPASHEAMILWAMTDLMARRLAQPSHLSNTHVSENPR